MDDLGFAHHLAETADAISVGHFRSEELRTVTKDDGTPVSQVDLAVEEAMLSLVRELRPNDAVVGEEVGEHPACSAPKPAAEATGPTRRWIFDGIDGTHNYAAGRPGWATIIALEVDGTIELGMVSSPRFGRRFWATRGGGAWSATFSDRALDAPVPLRCGSTDRLDNAGVIVIPYAGMLIGWRDAVANAFAAPATPRSQCFALDSVMVATGELDVSIHIFGAMWDVAATSLIATEAGAVFSDAWGGTRLDTATGIFTNAALLPDVLEVLAQHRPVEVDQPKLTKTSSVAIGTEEQQLRDEWRSFGVRPLPTMSARTRVVNAPPMILDIVDERAAELDRPFVGVTTDGNAVPGLRSLAGSAPVSTEAITRAGRTLLHSLSRAQREQACFAMDAIEWRMWINVHMNHFRHGLLLETLDPAVRERALDLLRATLSARGFEQARAVMRINGLLAEVTGDHEAFGEWPYFLSIFGDPFGAQPWGWQLDGHHLCLNVVVFDGRVVVTPAFMGSEPRSVNDGIHAGTLLFDAEESKGLALIRSLDAVQRKAAVIHPSIHPDKIPTHLQNLFDGRMQAGAFHDNLVTRYQGISGASMSTEQRHSLLEVADAFVGWSGPGHAEVRMREVEQHLDTTWFMWFGGDDDRAPFYYRVHSPVVLIEFDHHPGVAFDNEVPTRNHVHTVVRTPNGGDYGADLLAEHRSRAH